MGSVLSATKFTSWLPAFLLPVFFVLHGFTENFYLVPLNLTLTLLAGYLIATLLVLFLFIAIFRNVEKAQILTLFLFSLFFFFGSFHDALRNLNAGFLLKYSTLLTVFAIATISLVIYFKKTTKRFTRFTRYAFFLLVILIAIEAVTLAIKMGKDKSRKLASGMPDGFAACDTCSKKDIYLIITDEYSGASALKNSFQFDNVPFLSELQKRGFHVMQQGYSNYNFTPFSIASILNLDTLILKGNILSDQSIVRVYDQINRNRFVAFLESEGYEIHNFSPFMVSGQPAMGQQVFLPVTTNIIKSQTLFFRMQRDLDFHRFYAPWLRHFFENQLVVYDVQRTNHRILSETMAIAAARTQKPKLVYTHLVMPHFPYYFDENGKRYPDRDLLRGAEQNPAHYIGYLQYTNKVILNLIDEIQKRSPTPPVIVLMSDHGFRFLQDRSDFKTPFYTLNASYIAGGSHAGFRDSLSSINYMRTLVNTLFGQNFPLIQDRSYYIDTRGL